MLLHEANVSRSRANPLRNWGCYTDLGDYTYLLAYTHAHPNAFARPRGYDSRAFAAYILAFAVATLGRVV